MTDTTLTTTTTSNRNYVKVIYGLLGFGLVFPVTAIAAVIMAMLKRATTDDELLETHIRYQIRTFWFSALWWAISFALIFAFFVGYITMLITAAWVLYRTIKGFLRLSGDNPEPMY